MQIDLSSTNLYVFATWKLWALRVANSNANKGRYLEFYSKWIQIVNHSNSKHKAVLIVTLILQGGVYSGD